MDWNNMINEFIEYMEKIKEEGRIYEE